MLDYFAPVVRMKKLEGQVGNICGSKLACDTCGEINGCKFMLKIGDKVVCCNDRCAAPFGYMVSKNKYVCQCSLDMFELVRGELVTDIQDLIVGYSNIDLKRYYSPVKLPDLSNLCDNRCYSCQLSSKYKFISKLPNIDVVSLCSCSQ